MVLQSKHVSQTCAESHSYSDRIVFIFMDTFEIIYNLALHPFHSFLERISKPSLSSSAGLGCASVLFDAFCFWRLLFGGLLSRLLDIETSYRSAFFLYLLDKIAYTYPMSWTKFIRILWGWKCTTHGFIFRKWPFNKFFNFTNRIPFLVANIHGRLEVTIFSLSYPAAIENSWQHR